MKKAILAMSFLFLLVGCGGGDDTDCLDNCRWVRFIPISGNSYYIYVCDDRSDLIRMETGGINGNPRPDPGESICGNDCRER